MASLACCGFGGVEQTKEKQRYLAELRRELRKDHRRRHSSDHGVVKYRPALLLDHAPPRLLRAPCS